jgi:hypothetical protein
MKKRLVAFVMSLGIIVSNCALSKEVTFADSSTQPSSSYGEHDHIMASQFSDVNRKSLNEMKNYADKLYNQARKTNQRILPGPDGLYASKYWIGIVEFPYNWKEFDRPALRELLYNELCIKGVWGELLERDCWCGIEVSGPINEDENIYRVEVEIGSKYNPDSNMDFCAKIMEKLNILDKNEYKSDFERLTALYYYVRTHEFPEYKKAQIFHKLCEFMNIESVIAIKPEMKDIDGVPYQICNPHPYNVLRIIGDGLYRIDCERGEFVKIM